MDIEEQEVLNSIVINEAGTPPVPLINGVHPRVIKYFGVDALHADPRVIKRLEKINNWAFKDSDLDGALRKINNLEHKFGHSLSGRALIDKAFSYIIITSINK